MRFIQTLLLAACLLTGATVFAQGQSFKAVADKIVAVVGDKIILRSDIYNSIADARRQGANVPENADCMLLEQAIISKVLMLQAQKDSLPVTDEEVEAELDQRIRYYVNQLGSEDELVRMAGKSVYQIKDDARESVKERKWAEAMQRKIVENVRITPQEAKAFFDKIPSDSLPFFESELEIGQIIFYPKATRDLEEYIVTEMNNYKRQIESGSISFEALAKRVSEDPGSRDRGGMYEINRNDKGMWDPVFLSTSFRLKKDEISVPVKSDRFGYFLIQMIERKGDKATIRMILRVPPVTKNEILASTVKLDSIRTLITTGKMNFNEAASKFSEDPSVKFSGPFMMGRDGNASVTIDQLDKETVALISKMNVGDISPATAYTSEEKKAAVRIVFLKSRTEPHILNLRDDYNRIASEALEQKKAEVIDKWMATKIPTYYIMVDKTTSESCESLQKYNSTDSRGF
jgi:peptidyl-prolyl cis-trans isomerase SurA